MKLWGLAINNLEVNKKYNFAITVVTREDIKNSGASEEDVEGISGFLSNLGDVNGLLLLREEDDGMIKGSFRTAKQNINVAKMAKVFGGGGHAKAAGFKIKGKLIRKNGRWRIV
jgi:phosphoesterase RecJ-like protein